MAIKAPPESRKKIYRSLCYVLSDRVDQIAWDEFAPTDWELFSQMAEREGVAPLMYWKLKDSPVEVPPSTFNFLRSTYYQTLAQNTLMYQELERILKALDEAGIPAIVLKGAALAATVYEDIGLRPMGDLDLLVSRERLGKAVSILNGLDYEASDFPRPTPWIERVTEHNVNLKGGAGRDTILELHWSLISGDADWRSPPLEWFWEQTEPFVLPNKDLASREKYTDRNRDNPDQYASKGRCSSLRPSAHSLYLSAHLILQHGRFGTRLLWFNDLHLLASRLGQEVSWDMLNDQAQKYRWALAFSLAMEQVQSLLGTPFSDAFITALSQDARLSREPYPKIGQEASRPRTKAEGVWEIASFLGHGEQIKYAIAMLIPSPQYIRWRYEPNPTWLWPLYYPYRWMRMVKEAILTFSELIFLNKA
jgi:hypothetical protein